MDAAPFPQRKMSSPSSQDGFSHSPYTGKQYRVVWKKTSTVITPARLIHAPYAIWFWLIFFVSSVVSILESHGCKSNGGIMVGCWNPITSHCTISRVGSKTHLFAHVLWGYKVKCSGALNEPCLTLLKVEACNKLLPGDLSHRMLQMTHPSLSHPCLCLGVSYALFLSLTSVISWKELHTNCAAPWHCCLPTSLCFQPH